MDKERKLASKEAGDYLYKLCYPSIKLAQGSKLKTFDKSKDLLEGVLYRNLGSGMFEPCPGIYWFADKEAETRFRHHLGEVLEFASEHLPKIDTTLSSLLDDYIRGGYVEVGSPYESKLFGSHIYVRPYEDKHDMFCCLVHELAEAHQKEMKTYEDRAVRETYAKTAESVANRYCNEHGFSTETYRRHFTEDLAPEVSNESAGERYRIDLSDYGSKIADLNRYSVGAVMSTALSKKVASGDIALHKLGKMKTLVEAKATCKELGVSEDYIYDSVRDFIEIVKEH